MDWEGVRGRSLLRVVSSDVEAVVWIGCHRAPLRVEETWAGRHWWSLSCSGGASALGHVSPREVLL
jgi:hypothetical protein